MRNAIEQLCGRLGHDPLLVQGAGGNASWKDGDVLWVKASGTRLSDATQKDIFVPVDLVQVRDAVKRRAFSETPQVVGDSTLRPSIETLLHAIVPTRVVVHLHMVEALALLVQSDWREAIGKVWDGEVIGVDYFKPGAELAEAVHDQLISREDSLSEVSMFLGSHGIVVGAESSERAFALIESMRSVLGTSENAADIQLSTVADERRWTRLSSKAIDQLMQVGSHHLVEENWALYPDHVVFLGAAPWIVNDVPSSTEIAPADTCDALVFVRGDGAYVREGWTRDRGDQLRCYVEILRRLDPAQSIKKLNVSQIGELLDWDAERYRQGVSS
jgi:rhamnose utilization protein RhaD (predicted bifunctional aldolase and dehydrogenase)